MSETTKEKKKRGMPNSFTILIICLIIVAAITWAVAAFAPDVRAANLADITSAPVLGFQSAVQVCLFVMVLGGFLAMVNKTGALDAGIAALVRKLKGNEILLIPMLMILFGICGSTYGMMEETVPFYILLAGVTFAAGFDTMTGALIVLLGAGLGTLGSTVNPFSIAVATDSLTSMGIEVNQAIVIGTGLLLYIIAEAMGIFFVMRYAKKVKTDKNASIMTAEERAAAEKTYGSESSALSSDGEIPGKITRTQKIVLALFALSFAVMIVSFIPWESFGITLFALGGTADDPSTAWSAFLTGLPLGQWYFDECTIWFLLMAIAIGILGKLSEKDIVGTFIAGAADMVSVALIIALARGVSVLMTETGLDVWILTSAANALSGMPAFVFAPLSFALYFVLSFAIPSSSGMATLSMPIMGPLADGLGFSPEIMIMIYVAAHGIVVLFAPTNGVIIAGLELAKTSYATYIKLVAKFMVVLTVVIVIVLTTLMMVIA